MTELGQSISFFMFPFTLEREGVSASLGIDNFQLPNESSWKPLNMKIESDVFFNHIQSFLQKSVTGAEGELNQMKSCDLFIYSLVDKGWDRFFGGQSTFEMDLDGGKTAFFIPNNKNSFESPKLIVYPDASVGIIIIPIEIKRDDNKRRKSSEAQEGVPAPTMDTLMTLNYRLHKMDNQAPTIRCQKPTGLKEEFKSYFFAKMNLFANLLGVDYDVDSEKPIAFQLSLLVERLLSMMHVNYIMTNKKRCHVFTYLHIDEDKDLTEDEQDNLLRISRCENEKYQIIRKNETIKQTFKNIYLIVSVEGGAMMTCGNADFFKSFKTDSLQQRYIWLYLLALIQRYSLINMSKVIGDIDDTNDKQKIVSLKRLRDLSDRLTRIKVNTYYSDISDYKQHNEFYRFCTEELGVVRLLSDMGQKMDDLDDCLKQKADKNSENIQLLLAIFVAFLTVFSGCNDGFEFFKNVFNISEGPNPLVLIVIYWFVFAILFTFTLCMILKKRHELWEIIKDIVCFWKDNH